MKKVLAFGAFDPLHEGHRDFLRQAKALGDYLTVIVARDSAIRAGKKYTPHTSEEMRLQEVASVEYVDEAMLGSQAPHQYELLEQLSFDVIALGYDQQPEDTAVRQELNNRGKHSVIIARLKPFHPETYKSTYIRRNRDAS